MIELCVNAEDFRSHLELVSDLLSPEDSLKVVRCSCSLWAEHLVFM